MAEEKKAKSVDDVLKQIDEFKKTIHGLTSNVDGLQKKLMANKEKYGPDINQWPKEAK